MLSITEKAQGKVKEILSRSARVLWGFVFKWLGVARGFSTTWALKNNLTMVMKLLT
jgi:hypothetical protein